MDTLINISVGDLKKGGRNMKKQINLILLFLIFFTSIAFAADPVLFFSDLTSGPNVGWEGSSIKGAAVTVWGKNFDGPERGDNSYITIKNTETSVQLTNDSDYAEWGKTGTENGIPRDLERITFWLNQSCPNGEVKISVTVNGVTSNEELDFTVREGNIYFISVSDGNNDYNGRYSTFQGDSNGPFKDIKMFNPRLHPSGGTEPYIVYVKDGTYTTRDVDNTFVAIRGPYGGPDRVHALIAYPAETPLINAISQVSGEINRGVIWNAKYDPYGRNNNFVYSKLHIKNGTTAFELWGDNIRVIGNHMQDMNEEVWSGVVMVDNSEYARVYGNYFEHCGYDAWKHDIYIKTHRDHISGDKTVQYTYVGWNEFDRYTAALHSGESSRGGEVFVSSEGDEAYMEKPRTNHVYIHDNYFHDGNAEPVYTGDGSGTDIFVYNNIFENMIPEVPRGIFLGGYQPMDIYFYNNVFYNLGSADSPMIQITHKFNNCIFKNNIFYAREGQQFAKVDNYEGSSFKSDYDLYYDSDGTTDSPYGTRITVTNAIIGDPQFVSAGSDFHLQSDSPAIDAGTDTEEVREIVKRDFDNNYRPHGDGYDIGAYEFILYDCADADEDGYMDESCGGPDCDDGDPFVNPGEEEICDSEVDEDCDDLIDFDDEEDCFLPECDDEDGDGYEDEVCGGHDCDDKDEYVFPEAEEICDDGIDNDCDGKTDEDCLPHWCLDVDKDGFYASDIDIGDCGPEPADCDDEDPLIYPSAEEICGDDIDQDCDGKDLKCEEEDDDNEDDTDEDDNDDLGDDEGGADHGPGDDGASNNTGTETNESTITFGGCGAVKGGKYNFGVLFILMFFVVMGILREEYEKNKIN